MNNDHNRNWHENKSINLTHITAGEITELPELVLSGEAIPAHLAFVHLARVFGIDPCLVLALDHVLAIDFNDAVVTGICKGQFI